MPITAATSSLQQLLAWSLKLKLPMLQRCLLAIALVLGVAFAREAFGPDFLPFLFFIPVVTGIALVLGAVPGLLAGAVSAAASLLSYIVAHGHPTYERIGSTTLYALVLAGLVVCAATLRSMFEQLHERSEVRELANAELAHRLKNQLAVVQSIVAQSLRSENVDPAVRSTVSQRLIALGAASNILTQTSWSGGDMETLCHDVLGHKADPCRLRLSGQSTELQGRIVMPMALALHELATNAAKYGALSNTSGIIHLHWTVARSETGDRFRLIWREAGGPPVLPPTREGFGTKLVQTSLASYCGGDVTVRFPQDGMVFELDAPASVTLKDYA
ncbi:sensor histidine kinase [Brevundimonas nasdae]|uniref:sensor histidine kinase n=1 Tax=Brevundimonas nasdae TaxID=172043 RepID=UPI00301B1267